MTSVSILQLEGVSKQFGKTVTADRLHLTVYAGEFFTFLGPSGSGKSTLLRIIAGLERLDAGRLLIRGRDMANVPPWDRGLGMVFQQYAVFPHMTVAQNVGYGLRVRHRPPSETRRRVRDLLVLVGLEGKDGTNVTVLSGGEQQRVALARSLATEPALLLLDEPLGALDEKIRRGMQIELKHIQRQTGTTFIYVTHDQEEALTMSDRIAVMQAGRLIQCDTPEILFRHPRTRFVAGFFRGSNVVDATAEEAPGDRVHLHIAGRLITVPRPLTVQAPQERVAVAIRAEDLRVGPRAADAAVSIEAKLVDIVYRGANVDHVLELGDGQRVIATSTQREVDGMSDATRIGLDPDRVVLLED